MFRSSDKGPLSFIVAGFEHSGTTLVSEILRQHPSIDSAFEGGLLLPRKLSQFQGLEPFSSNFKTGWKISDEQLTDICKSTSYAQAYYKLRMYSPVIKNKKTKLFDKTPRYMQQLPTVVKKIKGLKSLVMVRDIRSLMDSTFSRSNLGFKEWFELVYPKTKLHTMSYLDGLTVALNDCDISEQIHVLRYEELILEQEQQSRALFDFLGFKFDPGFLKLTNVRYTRNVYGTSIRPDLISKYRRNLPEDFLNQVIKDFAPYSEYFWEP